MPRRRSAAAAHQVQQTLPGEASQLGGHLGGGRLVAAELVRQAGVGVAGHGQRRQSGELLDPGPHLRRPERAVDPHADQPGGPLHGVPEGLDGLAGEGAAAAVGDRHRDHQGQAAAPRLVIVVQGVEAGLQGEGVEDGLGQQQVHAPGGEALDLEAVARGDLVEAVAPEGGVLHVGREGEGGARGADRSGHEAGTGRVPGGGLVGRLARKSGRGLVDLAHEGLEAVVLKGDGCGVEGVGGQEVGAGRQAGGVDAAHVVGPGETEQVVAPGQVRRVVGEPVSTEVPLREPQVLDLGGHGPVEEKDALGQECAQVRHRGELDSRVRRRWADGKLPAA